jgi:hypothetical protein
MCFILFKYVNNLYFLFIFYFLFLLFKDKEEQEKYIFLFFIVGAFYINEWKIQFIRFNYW